MIPLVVMSDNRSSAGNMSSRPSHRPVRTFSWTYWLLLATALSSLVYYFIRAIARVKAVAITPTHIIDACFGFTPSTAYEILRALGPKGRAVYKEINRVDFIITPIVLREFLLDTLPPVSPRRSSVREYLANAYAVGDLVENICVAIMLNTYPRIPALVAWTGCVGNVVKWIGLSAAVFAILYEGVMWFERPKARNNEERG